MTSPSPSTGNGWGNDGSRRLPHMTAGRGTGKELRAALRFCRKAYVVCREAGGCRRVLCDDAPGRGPSPSQCGESSPGLDPLPDDLLRPFVFHNFWENNARCSLKGGLVRHSPSARSGWWRRWEVEEDVPFPGAPLPEERQGQEATPLPTASGVLVACASCLLEVFNLVLTCPGRYRELTGIDGEAKGGSPPFAKRNTS